MSKPKKIDDDKDLLAILGAEAKSSDDSYASSDSSSDDGEYDPITNYKVDMPGKKPVEMSCLMKVEKGPSDSAVLVLSKSIFQAMGPGSIVSLKVSR